VRGYGVSDINNLTMTGRLTRDPELRFTQSGLAICTFQLACNGYKKDDTCFTRCTAFGKKAESLQKHFFKGSRIGITGRLKLDQWEDKKTGQKREAHAIEVTDWAFIESNAKGSESGTQDDYSGDDWDAPVPANGAGDNTPF
jgi:single-strand DNA-binding protein